jgi:hypothetical protein
MYRTCTSIIYLCLLVAHIDGQNESVASFHPSSIGLVIGEQKSVTVHLLVSNQTQPINLEFLYDGVLNASTKYIDRLPNLIFTSSIDDNYTREIIITGRHEGHLVVTVQSADLNLSSTSGFLLIDVEYSRVLSLFISIVGWTYFAAWSISAYPQIIMNFTRRSVIGLNFDYLALNLVGQSAYTVFNVYLYTSRNMQKLYYEKHPHGVLPVLLNDVSSNSS